ncbi:MAG: VacJ family lipoprotein [Sneathiella sp.]
MSLRNLWPSIKGGFVGVALFTLLSGCATAPSDDKSTASTVMYEEAYDPFEPMNRYFFDVNYAMDALFLKPVSEIYRGVLPLPVRDSVRNFLTNLSQPIYFINNVLQGDLDGAGDNMGAFFTNTFLGLGGLFDIAQLNIPEDDMGQTFAIWGIEEGPYLVVPVLGPYTTREGVGGIVDWAIDPVNIIARENDKDYVGFWRWAADGLDKRSRAIETLDDIEKNSIDFYATIRSLYRQSRKSKILKGATDPTQLPSMSFEEDDEITKTTKTN